MGLVALVGVVGWLVGHYEVGWRVSRASHPAGETLGALDRLKLHPE